MSYHLPLMFLMLRYDHVERFEAVDRHHTDTVAAAAADHPGRNCIVHTGNLPVHWTCPHLVANRQHRFVLVACSPYNHHTDLIDQGFAPGKDLCSFYTSSFLRE